MIQCQERVKLDTTSFEFNSTPRNNDLKPKKRCTMDI